MIGYNRKHKLINKNKKIKSKTQQTILEKKKKVDKQNTQIYTMEMIRLLQGKKLALHLYIQ